MSLRYKRVDCSRCGGSGSDTCSWCGGSGKTKDSSNNIHEHNYVNEYVTCNFCGGSGLVRCPGCSGSGYVLQDND